MNPIVETAQREMYWNIASPYKFFIYPLVLIAMGVFAYGVYQKYKFIVQGQKDPARFGDWKKRAMLFLWEIPFQGKVLRDKQGGIIHVLIFWSFLALMLTTTVVFIDVDFGIDVYKGALYLALSLLADLAGLALLAGLIYAALRRYVLQKDKFQNRWDDAFALILLAAAIVTGFVLEGLRIHYAGDPWAAWSPVGWAFSAVMGDMGPTAVKRVYQATWWTHFAVLFGFIASFPYTKFSHIVTLPLNVFFSSTEPKGKLPRQDVEAMMSDEAAMENFNIGISEAKHLTWKQLLDYDACIKCGRCEDVCPSHQSGKPLSPKKLIADLKTFAQNPDNWLNTPAAEGAEPEPKLIVGAAFDNELIWECRTCRACMEVCPAHIEHIPQMIEMRRGEVMMRGQLPTDASVALKQLERGGNPFGPQEERSKWVAENKIPVIGPGEECDVLFWIGCCTTYDLLKQKVAYNVLKIMAAAGLKVGVLGDEENCCGDPAKLLGDENLYQSIVKAQIASIESRKFKYMITHCPHCFNTMKNEYPQFGAKFQVRHHTDVIAELIREKKIVLDLPIEKKVAYHDPCYLGRYNNGYEDPRFILGSIDKLNFVELDRHHDKSFCCGGGGGHYWMDIPTGERINVNRMEEVVSKDPDILAVGCVYCLQMLNDSLKIMDLEEKMQIYDVSELVVRAMSRLADAKSLPTAGAQKEKKAAAA